MGINTGKINFDYEPSPYPYRHVEYKCSERVSIQNIKLRLLFLSSIHLFLDTASSVNLVRSLDCASYPTYDSLLSPIIWGVPAVVFSLATVGYVFFSKCKMYFTKKEPDRLTEVGRTRYMQDRLCCIDAVGIIGIVNLIIASSLLGAQYELCNVDKADNF